MSPVPLDMMRPRTPMERELHGETPQVGNVQFGSKGNSIADEMIRQMGLINDQVYEAQRERVELALIQGNAARLVELRLVCAGRFDDTPPHPQSDLDRWLHAIRDVAKRYLEICRSEDASTGQELPS